jgi:hypothetical protein
MLKPAPGDEQLQDVAHVKKRIGRGALPEQINTAANLTPERRVTGQLSSSPGAW